MSHQESYGHRARQEHATEKHPVMVYMPQALFDYLVLRCEESGLSYSSFMVLLLRLEKRSTKNVSDNVT